LPIAAPSSDGTTITTIWEQSGVRVEERLYFAQNSATGRPDTTAIEYTIRNDNASSRSVGLRIMLDVMVGDNDGAPYFILGTGQVTQQAEWNGVNVPDYWISYESATFDPASLKGRGQLAGNNAIKPERFVIADWPQAHGTVWDYAVNSSDPVTNDSAVILYYNPVTLSAGQTRTVRTFYGIAPAGETAQLELTGLEVTQAVQDLENSVEIIQDKPTFVRAHVHSTSGTVGNVTAKLIGKRDGNPLPSSPLQPANTGGSINVLENPNRSTLDDSFFFELPETWRSGTVEFEFQGDNHTFTCREKANTDNDCKATVSFIDSPASQVSLVGIIWHESNNTQHDPGATDYAAVVQDIEAEHPIPELDWSTPSEITWESAGPPDISAALVQVSNQRTLDGSNDIYFGLMVDHQGGYLGLGYTPGDASVGYYRTTDPTTAAHETGHNFGRQHTNCSGGELNPDTSYPYDNGHISQEDSGDNAFYGFHITTHHIFPPNTGDLLGYCRPRWVSDWTYERIRTAISSKFGSSATTPQSELAAGENAVLVSGIIKPAENLGTISLVLNTVSQSSITLPAPGSYLIRFEDSGAQVLASYSFEPVLLSEGSDQIFSLLLPRHPNTARIVLLHNGQILDSRSASANAPSVTVISPNGGETLSGSTATLSWVASDPDSDTLEYTVQYSTDAGVSWRTLVSSWHSTTYVLNLSEVPGTAQGLLRVLASDGFHTSQDQSNSTFTVAKHAPQPIIQIPENNALFVGNQTIILEGNAHDAEDGLLGDSGLSWNSNLNGNLGSGQSLAINASSLAEGTHTITLVAQDSDGQTGTTSITIRVYRSRPALPASLSISPEGLSFTARQNGGQTAWKTLSIRNGGDGTLTWSATAGQSWMRISSLSGTAPTDILIAADPTGLAIGEYTGTITITASEASNSPQVIPVTFFVREPLIATYNVYLPLVTRNYSSNPSDTYEPNDTLATAYGPLASGTTYTSYLPSSTDVDYYYFDISTLGQVTIDLSNINAPGSDYDMLLGNSSGLRVGYSTGVTSTEQIIFQPTDTGRYYVEVYPYSGADPARPYYLKVQYNGTVGVGDIYGTVYANGSPKPAAPIILNFYDYNTYAYKSVWSITNGSGQYHFRGMSPLGSNQIYYSYYYGALGESYIGYYYSPDLTSYSAGSSVMAGNLDISPLNLGTPNSTTGIPFPVNFTWTPRPTSPSETYQFYLYDTSDYNISYNSSDLGHVANFILSGLPTGFTTGYTYRWYVYAYGSGGGGGGSFYRNNVAFSTTGVSVYSAPNPLDQMHNRPLPWKLDK
jgi:hypothetical protein